MDGTGNFCLVKIWACCLCVCFNVWFWKDLFLMNGFIFLLSVNIICFKLMHVFFFSIWPTINGNSKNFDLIHFHKICSYRTPMCLRHETNIRENKKWAHWKHENYNQHFTIFNVSISINHVVRMMLYERDANELYLTVFFFHKLAAHSSLSNIDKSRRRFMCKIFNNP